MNFLYIDRKKLEKYYDNCKAIVKARLSKEEMDRLTMKDFFSLLRLNIKVTYLSFIEYIRVIYRYYGNTLFMKADISMRLMYFFNNPYRISKRFLKSRNSEDIYAYGETPLTSLEVIADAANISPKDTVYELGCGRGLTCFWLNAIRNCTVLGIEYNPEFVERAKKIVTRLNIKRLKFFNADFIDINLQGATVCYLYGTCLDDDTIYVMINKFAKLSPGTKIITVSFSLRDYPNSERFELMHKISVPFTWGTADVYIQVVK